MKTDRLILDQSVSQWGALSDILHGGLAPKPIFGAVVGVVYLMRMFATSNSCCSTERCELRCPNGFRRDLLGLEVCECADSDLLSTSSSQSPSPTRPAVPSCPPLIGCSKECLYGYRTDRYGCSRCRCNRCPPFNCAKKCRDGFAYSSDGCKLCRCLGQSAFHCSVTVGGLIVPTGTFIDILVSDVV